MSFSYKHIPCQIYKKKDKQAGLIKKMFVKHKIQYPLQPDCKNQVLFTAIVLAKLK